jgi:hypothetical protein
MTMSRMKRCRRGTSTQHITAMLWTSLNSQIRRLYYLLIQSSASTRAVLGPANVLRIKGAPRSTSSRSLRLTSAGNTKLGTRSYSNVMSQIALARKGSGRSMTWHGIRNAFTRKSQSADQRCCTCVSDITALGAIRNGLDWIIFASISPECIIPRTRRRC